MSHYGFDRLIRELEHHVSQHSEQKSLVAAIAQSMQKLISSLELSSKFVEAIKAGQTDGRIYTSPEHGFFVQVFHWPAGVKTPIHNHNTWGVMGILHNQLHVTEYSMTALETPGQFDVSAKDDYQAQRGAIIYLTAPDDEIHQIVNDSDQESLSVHIYGAEMQGTLNFDLEAGRVYAAGS